ncbi:ABC transporter substrate-binding protein [Croceicoccus sp. F390]|uniref:ABC transporter substrate-binding protein n=1 Tax=Croceicoccus esteveae TaxID=3075597 RepID=A0ABU2ZL90_9SPHN|nr:ABC transporter substrate-binding protein [Croceicoccus sp. F390]MDT0577099.1 ABC transporter substrate-binding protein [Croceicoccus sp. F390]
MAVRSILAVLFGLSLVGCAQPALRSPEAPRRIISLDYCADQYVLRFADRGDILALSPGADEHFSYMRAAARGLPQIRPRTADVLALKPDLVVRSYGGDPNITAFMERAGVPVVQIGFPQTIEQVREEVARVGAELGQADTARRVIADMDKRLGALAAKAGDRPQALYMTPAGVTTGSESLVHELMTAAGLANFQTRSGWNQLPLERLAYERPDLIVAAFFESTSNHVDSWSAARHPVAQAQLRELPVATVEGAWTSCGGWFLVEAIETMSRQARGVS